MLGELMRLKQGIAIAGTHGKTTTTSLVASVLAEGGLDPTFVIGGKLNSAGANARLGQGDFIVVEADESDASFLQLFPTMEVVTNIDADHMETYQHDMARLKHAFVQFIQRMPFYGVAVLCIDDLNVKDIIPFVSQPILRYGLSEEADIRASNIQAVGTRMHFTVDRRTVRRHGMIPGRLQVELNLPGLHNVRNALAAIGIATELGVSDEAIMRGLSEFSGVGRRFQRFGEIPLASGGSFTLIDDYGHHPVEMAATLEAARGAFPGQRLVLAFQPHRFTRTRDCFGEFVEVLKNFDALVLTEVYPAGEAKISGADSKTLMKVAMTNQENEKSILDVSAVAFAATVAEMPEKLSTLLRAGDVLITMGAGSISSLPHTLSGGKHV
jgi:UDP-N-acetylmuramate--alanine ligase